MVVVDEVVVAVALRINDSILMKEEISLMARVMVTTLDEIIMVVVTKLGILAMAIKTKVPVTVEEITDMMHHQKVCTTN